MTSVTPPQEFTPDEKGKELRAIALTDMLGYDLERNMKAKGNHFFTRLSAVLWLLACIVALFA